MIVFTPNTNFNVPGADNVLNTTINELLGNKTDNANLGAAPAVNRTVMNYIKWLSSQTAAATANLVNADYAQQTIGNKADDPQTVITNTRSLMSIGKGILTSRRLTAYQITDDVLHSNDPEKDVTDVAYTLQKEIVSPYIATLRIYLDHYVQLGGQTLSKIYKNGIAVGIERDDNVEGWHNYTEDIAGCVAGDLIQLYSYEGTGTHTGKVRNFRILGAAHFDFYNSLE